MIGLLFLSSTSYADRIAIYHGSGVWGPSTSQTKSLLRRMGHTIQNLTAAQIRHGDLRTGEFRAIFIPGGASWVYAADLGELGQKEIRTFVEGGGGYLGTCAGAFLALSDRIGGAVTGPFGLGLIHGTSVDPFRLGIKGFGNGMKKIRFHMAGFKNYFKVLFLEGPFLRISPEALERQNGVVVAHYSNGEIAAAAFESGRGRVFITGPHMEVDEKRTRLRFRFHDPDSEWPILKLWISYLLGGPQPEIQAGNTQNLKKRIVVDHEWG